MKTLDDLKKVWNENSNTLSVKNQYDEATLEKIIRTRLKKHTNASFQYFWASFGLQLLVYGLLSHVIIKYWNNSGIHLIGLVGMIMNIPFTIMLMIKFKSMARSIGGENRDRESLLQCILQQKALLTSFYRFKSVYEFFLIPLSSAIGVYLVFTLYVPGGITEHWTGAGIVFLITLLSCLSAIITENKKSFKNQIEHLQQLLDEFNSEK
jgi:hypothetical protein